jgi:hypothetical protein
MNGRRVDMGNTLHPLVSLHPGAVIGSLVAGAPNGGVGKRDAEPLPEREKHPVHERIAALLRRPRPAPA